MKIHCLTPFFLVLLSLEIHPAQAQITPNAPLNPEASRVVPLGPGESLIEGGAARGANLFHSFEAFNVPTRELVLFGAPDGIERVVGKVTGGSVSRIDGGLGVLDLTTGALSAADLFLLNPNGIVLGPNARSLVLGSLFLTSAERLQFGGYNFVATSTELPSPLLNIGVPVGLQMGQAPGAIVQEPPNFGAGLAVAPGKSLTLLGGDIILSGTAFWQLTGGRLELGAVGSQETVGLRLGNRGYQLDYRPTNLFQDIQLRGTLISEPAAVDGLEAQFQGRAITLLDGAVFVTTVMGNQPGGDITIRASESLQLLGGSLLLTEVFPDAVGQGGDIWVEAPMLSLQQAGQIGTASNGVGNAGNLTLRASDSVMLSGVEPFETSPLLIFSVSTELGTGNTGSIEIETPRFFADRGGNLSTQTFGVGQAGDISIQGVQTDGSQMKTETDIQLFDNGIIGSFSAGPGNSGNVWIQADRLRLEGGSQVRSEIFGEGDLGRIEINARNIEAKGALPGFDIPSGLFADVRLGASGNGSVLSVNSEQINLTDGARIRSSTRGAGRAASIEVQADNIEIVDSILGSFSEGSGRSGDVFVTTNQLLLTDGGQLTAITFAEGDAGRLQVEARSIEARGIERNGFVSGLFAGVEPNASGNGEALLVDAEQILLFDGGTIESRTSGPGQAASLDIQASDRIIISGRNLQNGRSSAIASSTDTGFQAVFGLPRTSGGEGGELQVQTPLLRLEAGAVLSSKSRSDGSGGSILLQIDRLEVESGAQIQASAFEQGDSGTIDITAAETITVRGRDPNYEAQFTQFGDRLANFPESAESAITARSFGDGTARRITLKTDELQINNQGLVSVSSEGNSAAGNLDISANRVVLENGILQANTRVGAQGGISLQALELLLLRQGSAITTNAGNESTGGNITVDSDFIIAIPTENSDITANALRGQGGQVEIRTNGLIGIELRDRLTSANDITASSESGIQGTVTIQGNVGAPETQEAELPGELVDPSNQLLVGCLLDEDADFVATGRGGIPANSSEILNQSLIWQDARTAVAVDRPVVRSDIAPALQEAQAWRVNEQNQIELFSVLPKPKQSRPVSCH